MNLFHVRFLISVILTGFAHTVVAQEGDSAKSAPATDNWLAGLASPESRARIEVAQAVGSWFDSLGPREHRPVGFSDVPPAKPPPTDGKPDAGGLGHHLGTVERLVIALEPLLSSEDPDVLKAAAQAIASVPVRSAEIDRALIRSVELRDPDVDTWVLSAVKRLKPAPDEMVPLLARRLIEYEKWPLMYAWTLSEYGEAARPAIAKLLPLLTHERERPREAAASVVLQIGLDEATARRLESGEIPAHPALEYDVFLALLKYPAVAASYLRARPELAPHIGEYFTDALILCRLGERADGLDELRAALLAAKGLRPVVIAILGDATFLPELRARAEAAAAAGDPHQLAFLEACARACGAPAGDRIARLSKAVPDGPRPSSAWPGSNDRRTSKDSIGHGDGETPVVVTGRLLMPDGKPVANPAFYATNDRMLLGRARKEREPIPYDPATGHFVYVTSVFAAYDDGKGQHEPGPYQTGSAQTLIEADGAEPLTVRFFDEMPAVEVTLSPKAARGLKP